MRNSLSFVGICLLLLVGLAHTKATGQNTKVDWFSLASGGGWVAGPGAGMNVAVGEGLVGDSKGENVVLTSGFLSAMASLGSVVGVREPPQVPKAFFLHQNYPNPFNPTTTIRFALPHASKVSLKVFSVLGQEAATLVDEEKPAGVYEVMFNAASLSSGMYVYRLRAGDFVAAKRLLLLK